MRLFSSSLAAVKDFFFTTRCFHCSAELAEGENRVCDQCWNSLTPVTDDDYTYRVMLERFTGERIVDEFIPLYYFEKNKLLQSLAHSLKYEEITAFGTELGKKIGVVLRDKKISTDVIIPVPLNKRKERERGYNQSDFLAEGVSQILKIPVLRTAVKRVKYTVTQTHLNADQRKENISDAFAVSVRHSRVLKNAAVLIVDDIITTGSTIQELGKAVKAHGATRIIAASAGLAKLGEDA